MAARHADRADFIRLSAEFPRRALLDLLGVDRATLRRWCSGATRIPWAAYQLVHERSRYGLAERDSAEHFNRSMLTARNNALQEKVARLESELVKQAELIDWRCANDPFISPTDPRTQNADRRAPPAAR